MVKAAQDNVTGCIFLEKSSNVAVLGWWNGTRDVLIERADGSRAVRPFRGLRKPLPLEPYRVALEAEQHADLIRAEAGVPPAVAFADDEGITRRGPKDRHPERAALSTFWAIEQLNRISLVLAGGGLPPERCEGILASLPPELRDDFGSAVGQHRRHGRRQRLSRGARKDLVRGIASSRDLLNRKPNRDTWTPVEMSEFDRTVELRAANFGPSATRKIKDLIESQIQSASTGSCAKQGLTEIFATRDIHVLEGPSTPAYVRGIPERLDKWGAARHGVTLLTFRSWRTKLRKNGWLSTPPQRGRARRLRDN